MTDRPTEKLLQHLREHGATRPDPVLVKLLMAEIDWLRAELAEAKELVG